MTKPKTFKQAQAQTASPNAGRRQQQALQRLGENTPRCLRCGEDDPHCLELHHVAGRAFDAALVTLCGNCHRKASDMQRDHPSKIGAPPSLVEKAGHFLLGLADLFELLINKCREFGGALIEWAKIQPNFEPQQQTGEN